MRLYTTENYDEMSKKAASLMAAQILEKSDSVLGLATGSTPVGVYKILVEWYYKGVLDFSQIKAVNLDEYKGIGAENVQSYAYFMKEQLFSKVNIAKENTFIPDGNDADSKQVCQNYENTIKTLGGLIYKF